MCGSERNSPRCLPFTLEFPQGLARDQQKRLPVLPSIARRLFESAHDLAANRRPLRRIKHRAKQTRACPPWFIGRPVHRMSQIHV